jgi:hypothetical protein
MDDNELIYEVHVPTESPELAGMVMREAGALGSFGTRVYAIEEGRRRPVRQKELALVLVGATEPRPEDRYAPPTAEPSEILEAIRFTLGVVKRALLGRITP